MTFQDLRRKLSWTPNPKKLFVTIATVGILSLCTVGQIQAAQSTDSLLKNYENALEYAEQLKLHEEDPYQILPRLKRVTTAILSQDWTTADSGLQEIQSQFELDRRFKKTMTTQAKMAWFEIYFDLLQKFAWVAVVAWLLIQIPSCQKGMLNNNLQIGLRISFSFLISLAGIIIAMQDLARYGKTAWMFFDVQVVLTMSAGLWFGWLGALTAIISGVGFRYVIGAHDLFYALPLLAAGMTGAVFTPKNIAGSLKGVILAGFLGGLIHALCVFLPAGGWMKGSHLMFSLLFLAIFEALGAVLFYGVVRSVLHQKKEHERERELLKNRLLFLQAQISPHFLFNALNTIQAVCESEHAVRSRKLLIQLSDFLRRILKRETDEITLDEEFEYLSSFLNLQKERYQERLLVNQSIKLSEESRKMKIPLLILQPILENAVHYAVSSRREGGQININADDANGSVHIVIEDNGPGIPEYRIEEIFSGRYQSQSSTGIGLKNIAERLRQRYGKNYGLKISKAACGRGARVEVHFPKVKREVAA